MEEEKKKNRGTYNGSGAKGNQKGDEIISGIARGGTWIISVIMTEVENWRGQFKIGKEIVKK